MKILVRAIKPANAQVEWRRVLLLALAAAVSVLPLACSKPGRDPKRERNMVETVQPASAPVRRAHAGHLQDGTEWEAVSVVVNSAASPRSLTATIGKHAVEIPRDAFDGLPAWDDSLVVQFAEDSGDVFLVLADGRQPSAWNAKFLIRESRIIERELSLAKAEPLVVRFPAMFELQHGTIPPEELEKYRRESSNPQPAKPTAPL